VLPVAWTRRLAFGGFDPRLILKPLLRRLPERRRQPSLAAPNRRRRSSKERLAGWGDYSCFSENVGFAKDSGTNDPKTQ
jgi:hypothetical protein